MEIRLRTGEFQDREVTSVFFGGGTPSLLEVEELGEIMSLLRRSMRISPEAEITVESNPGTVDLAKLEGYRKLGINRLSIGVQSADNAELRLLGRIHTWEQFLDTYLQAEKAGFENINLDLISALPGQTRIDWEKNLNAILALRPLPRHISAYSLILEEGTRFQEWDEQGMFRGHLAFPSEEEERDIYHVTESILEKAGYQKYEISNYTFPGYECRHNVGYWTRRDYLGLGLGAASLLSGRRYKNTEDLSEYLRDPMDTREEQRLSREDEMAEMMFLGLRMCRGVFREEFQRTFGTSMDEIYGEVIQKNTRDGLLLDEGERIFLTPKGMDLSNYVSAQFLL